MRYQIFLTVEARDQIRVMQKTLRRRIGEAISRLETDLSGDVKKLSARHNAYRLRVGSYRILFRLDANRVEVYAVKDRKDAYG